MAEIYENQGNSTKAHDCYVQPLAAYEKGGCPLEAAGLLHKFGRRAENLDDSLQYDNRAMVKFEETGTHLGMAMCLSEMGNLCNKRGQYSMAQEHYIRGLAACEAVGNNDTIAMTLLNLAEVSTKQGRHKWALEYYTGALAVCGNLDNCPHDEAHLLFSMAEV
ncbi:hypothetical protein BDD12DRAFT_809085 [Trichophaea hybrida]|nr:hypothetical protein BDD12DRAFT_809085 [Trichophaea hybrida]